MANEILGEIQCEACETMANIKRKATGKKLLYIHCPKCGLDQRSGAKMQAKLEAVVSGEQSPPEQAEQANEAKPATKADEWQPSVETHKNEVDESEPKKGKSAFKFAIGSLLTVASVAGALLIKGSK